MRKHTLILSFNFYYAHPGQEDAVLRQRLRACDVRQDLKIPRGLVTARTQGTAALPDVIWEHRFEAVAGHHDDMAVRAASREFEEVRAGMRKLCRRFERPLFEICNSAATLPAAAPQSSIVRLDWFFCAPGKSAEVLAILQARAPLESGAGLLLRLITPGNDLPDFIWRQDGAGAEMPKWPAEINPLLQRIEHSEWKVA